MPPLESSVRTRVWVILQECCEKVDKPRAVSPGLAGSLEPDCQHVSEDPAEAMGQKSGRKSIHIKNMDLGVKETWI